jgi:hypothetical protein
MRKIYFHQNLWHLEPQFQDDLKYILQDDSNNSFKIIFSKLSIILNKKYLYDM